MRRGFNRFIPMLLGLLLCQAALAHDTLSDYVQHDVTLDVGPTYIDVALRLTFFEEHAESQQRLLDVDEDGIVTPDEQIRYRKTLLASLGKTLKLQLGGKALDLLPLYDPDFRLSKGVAGEHDHARFVVKSRLFARRPKGTARDGVIIFRDGLYPKVPAMAALHVHGQEGIRVSIEDNAAKTSRAGGALRALELRARIHPGRDETHEPVVPTETGK
jgi:hypothetical protein